MKPRTLLYTLIGSLAVVIIIWIFSIAQTVQTEVIIQAAVDRDCAPWDGTAYMITIPDHANSAIIVSIWKSPDFRFPVTYSFPDSSGRVGTAIHQSALASFQQLNGKITLQPFQAGSPIEGRFNFRSEDGEQFIGKFKAEWENQVALCG